MHQLYLVFARLTLFLFLASVSTVINADSLESLLMPGKLIKAHKKYEQECTQCHDTSDKDKQGQLCVQRS